MAQFKDLWVNLAIFGLLIFGMFSLGITLQDNNSTNESLKNNTLINTTYNNLSSRLDDLEDSTNTQKANFESESPTLGFGSLIFFTITSAGKVFNGLVIGIYNVLIKFPVTTLGLSPIVSGVLTAVLVVLIVLGLWAVYKLGG